VVVAAISQRRSNLAMGNILGSSISNILGAFSLGLIVHPGAMVFDRSSRIYSAALLGFTTILAAVLAFGVLSRVAGIILIVLFVGYVASVGYGIYKDVLAAPEDSDSDDDGGSDSNSESGSDDEGPGQEKLNKIGHSGSDDGLGEGRAGHEMMPLTTSGKPSKSLLPRRRQPPRSLLYHICQLVIGFFVLSLSGYILSHSVSAIADAFQLSSTLLGITILSIATTLPEKVIAVVSGARGHSGIVVANTAGSNVFLLTLCSGVLLLAGNLEYLKHSATPFELIATWVSSVLFFLAVFFGSSRWVGVALFSLYIGFIVLEFTMNRR
jgi:Ca2+/Na+ antiporter